MKYAVVIEDGPENLSAYVPDLPGCVATGKTEAELMRVMAGAIPFHLEGLRQDGLPIAGPTTRLAYVEAS